MTSLRIVGALLAGLSLASSVLASAQGPTSAPPKPHAPAKPAVTNTKVKADTAATAPARKSGKGEEQAVKWFNMLDADGDGRVSRKEAEMGFRIKPSLKNDFQAADLNRDGYLTQDEIRTVADRRRAERQARRAREQAAAARQAGNAPAK